MTAIVGVLNKRAAVMAADSAITVTRGEQRKIYNSATKIFKLSDDYPVGVMLFSSMDFMGMPWDIIIKMYHKNRGNQCFYDLKGYVRNFIDFLCTEPLFKDMQSLSHEYLMSEIMTYYERVKDNAIERVKEDLRGYPDGYFDNLSDDGADEFMKTHVLEVISDINKLSVDVGMCPEFEHYSFNDFCEDTKDEFNELLSLCKDDGMPANIEEEWEKGLYCYLTHGLMYNGTGLVFVGYGEKEIYPSLIPVYMSGIIDGKLRYSYSEGETAVISNQNRAAIQPFAQGDVMQTMMKGIAPNMYELVVDAYTEMVDSVKKKMIEVAMSNGVSEELLEKMRKLDMEEVKEEMSGKLSEFVQREYVDGIIDAIDSFGIEDMANMAESLVSITNLQRHITSSEESVGGPVDVAVITRSEGFVWLKHKTKNG